MSKLTRRAALRVVAGTAAAVPIVHVNAANAAPHPPAFPLT